MGEWVSWSWQANEVEWGGVGEVELVSEQEEGRGGREGEGGSEGEWVQWGGLGWAGLGWAGMAGLGWARLGKGGVGCGGGGWGGGGEGVSEWVGGVDWVNEVGGWLGVSRWVSKWGREGVVEWDGLS